jgi:hypothetical protein
MNELYDLDADPYEERNLVAERAARPVLERIQGELARLRRETGDRTVGR